MSTSDNSWFTDWKKKREQREAEARTRKQQPAQSKPESTLAPASSDDELAELDELIAEPKSKQHRHCGVEVSPRLFASSFRGGIAGKDVVVILTPEVLGLVIRPGWSTLKLPEFSTAAASEIIYWPWRDYGVPGDVVDAARKLIALFRLHQAGKTIEVACYGGHGRTATVLAVLAGLAEGWHPSEAVASIRAVYCEKGVETKEQERFVERMLRAIREALDAMGERYPAVQPSAKQRAQVAADAGALIIPARNPRGHWTEGAGFDDLIRLFRGLITVEDVMAAHGVSRSTVTTYVSDLRPQLEAAVQKILDAQRKPADRESGGDRA